MYAPSPPLAPPVPPAPTPTRYTYLVGRLRGRQITMEEATELFSLQQTMISQATVINRPPSDDAPEPSDTPADPSSGTPAPATAGFSDENVALGLLAMGVGSGLLAAVLKRAQEGPKPPAR